VLLFCALWIGLLFIGYPMPRGFLAVLVVEGCLLTGFVYKMRRAETPAELSRSHGALLLTELVCHSAIFYFLGGVLWLGSIAYLYALLYAAVFLTWRQAAVFAFAICIAFLSTVALDAAGVIPHQWYLPQGPDRYQDPHYLVPTCISFVGVIATVTFWMVFIGEEMRRERNVALRANAELMHTQEELRQLNEMLEAKVAERTKVLAFRAEHDQLTGLLNRGSISRRAQETITLARRDKQQVAVIVADGDNFKTCNDTGGHVYGDQVLRTLADSLRESCRESDTVGRFGGDEFLILLPGTDGSGAARYCRRLLAELADKRGKWPDSRLPFPSVSLGVAVFPQHGDDVEELVRVADKAMYDAKASGGGRWRVGANGDVFELPDERVTDERPEPETPEPRKAVPTGDGVVS